MMAEQLAAADRALSRFFFTNGEGGIRLFAAQPPISVVTQLKDPCQSAEVRTSLRQAGI
jgi:hypothetical protein